MTLVIFSSSGAAEEEKGKMSALKKSLECEWKDYITTCEKVSVAPLAGLLKW